VTGLGAVTNLGTDVPSTWDAMLSGRSGIARVEAFDVSSDGWAVKIAGEVRGWDPSKRIDAKAVRRMDRFAAFALYASHEAMEDAGLDAAEYDHTRVGVSIGSGVGGVTSLAESHAKLLRSGPERVNPFTVPKLMLNAATAQVAIGHGFQGPNTATATACASSGHAILAAYDMMQRGLIDIAVAGGSEAAVSPLCLAAFMTMKALSTRNDDPERASRPFDNDRDGFVLSEGCGLCVMETAEHAMKRGANILCEVRGIGASCDADHITAPNAKGRGASQAMVAALKDAELNPDEIGLINAHGTATPLGDTAEIAAVRNVFGDAVTGVCMTSTKSMTGHVLGGTGAIELIPCVLGLQHNLITPTINLDDPEDAHGIQLVANTARECRYDYALNNTFGFGGHNVSIAVGRFEG
jgi:3-oxoacyl-[acyl-carrier-protein] synthase II